MSVARAVTVEEHNQIVQNVVATTTDAAEHTRRELCAYGTAVTTIANSAVNHLALLAGEASVEGILELGEALLKSEKHAFRPDEDEDEDDEDDHFYEN